MKVCESISQTVVLYIFVLIFHFEWSRALDKKRINRKRRDCKDINLRNVRLYSIRIKIIGGETRQKRSVKRYLRNKFLAFTTWEEGWVGGREGCSPGLDCCCSWFMDGCECFWNLLVEPSPSRSMLTLPVSVQVLALFCCNRRHRLRTLPYQIQHTVSITVLTWTQTISFFSGLYSSFIAHTL